MSSFGALTPEACALHVLDAASPGSARRVPAQVKETRGVK